MAEKIDDFTGMQKDEQAKIKKGTKYVFIFAIVVIIITVIIERVT